jgi:hypothetical protein
MRKPHPCGGSEWTVTRIGADIGLRCNGCQRKIMLTREAFEKGTRHLLPGSDSPTPDVWYLQPSGPSEGEAVR